MNSKDVRMAELFSSLNDDCLIEILSYIDWETFFQVTKMIPNVIDHLATYINDILSVNYRDISTKNPKAKVLIHARRIRIEVSTSPALKNLLRQNEVIRELELGPIFEPINYIQSEKIIKLKAHGLMSNINFNARNGDCLTHIFSNNSNIRYFKYLFGFIFERNMINILRNPIETLKLEKVTTHNYISFINFFTHLTELKTLHIINSKKLQRAFFDNQSEHRDRVENLKFDVFDGTALIKYCNLESCTGLKSIHIFFHTREKIESFFGYLKRLCKNSAIENILIEINYTNSFEFLEFEVQMSLEKLIYLTDFPRTEFKWQSIPF